MAVRKLTIINRYTSDNVYGPYSVEIDLTGATGKTFGVSGGFSYRHTAATDADQARITIEDATAFADMYKEAYDTIIADHGYISKINGTAPTKDGSFFILGSECDSVIPNELSPIDNEDGTGSAFNTANNDADNPAKGITVVDMCPTCSSCAEVLALRTGIEYFIMLLNLVKDTQLYYGLPYNAADGDIQTSYIDYPDAGDSGPRTDLAVINTRAKILRSLRILNDPANSEYVNKCGSELSTYLKSEYTASPGDYENSADNIFGYRGLRLLEQYITTVHMWNYAVVKNNYSTDISPTPEDDAGMLIKTKMSVPICVPCLKSSEVPAPIDVVCTIEIELDSGNAHNQKNYANYAAAVNDASTSYNTWRVTTTWRYPISENELPTEALISDGTPYAKYSGNNTETSFFFRTNKARVMLLDALAPQTWDASGPTGLSGTVATDQALSVYIPGVSSTEAVIGEDYANIDIFDKSATASWIGTGPNTAYSSSVRGKVETGSEMTNKTITLIYSIYSAATCSAAIRILPFINNILQVRIPKSFATRYRTTTVTKYKGYATISGVSVACTKTETVYKYSDTLNGTPIQEGPAKITYSPSESQYLVKTWTQDGSPENTGPTEVTSTVYDTAEYADINTIAKSSPLAYTARDGDPEIKLFEWTIDEAKSIQLANPTETDYIKAKTYPSTTVGQFFGTDKTK